MAMKIPELATLSALFIVCACSGGGDPDASDAATDAPADGEDATEAPFAVAPPDPVNPPQMTPCPEGWREVHDPEAEITTCDPWPEGGPDTCMYGQVHFPGEQECRTVGTTCPDGDPWAEDLPADVPLLYVQSSAPAGGDGTRAAPFSTIADALEAASAETVVALARGTYPECFILPASITLWGACAMETVVRCPVASEEGPGTIATDGADTALVNLSVQGPRPGVWVEGAGASMSLRGVFITSTDVGALVVIRGGHVDAEDLVIRDVGTRSADGVYGRAIEVWGGSTAHVRKAVVERAANQAVMVMEPSTEVTLEDTVIRDTQPNPITEEKGGAVRLDSSATLTLRRCVLEDNRHVGVACSAATLNVEDGIVRRTASELSSREYGNGITADASCDVTMDRCLLETNRSASVVFQASTGTLTDVVVRDTLHTQLDDQWGRGLNVQAGSHVDVLRARFHENTDIAVMVGESTATLTDVHVSNTRPRPLDQEFGQGVNVAQGAEVQIHRMLLTDNFNMGLAVIDSTVTVTDLEVSGTNLPQPFSWQSFALGAVNDATLDATRVLIHDNHENAVGFEYCTVHLTDIQVRDTLGRDSDGYWGRGLVAQDGAHVWVTRGLFLRNREIGVAAFGTDATLVLADVAVQETLERACADTTCPDAGAGVGVGSYGGAHVDMSSFSVTDSHMCGLQLAYGNDPVGVDLPSAGTMELYDGEVAYNPIGVNNQNEELDIELLTSDVLYYENDRNLDSSHLPVPSMNTTVP